MLAVALSILAAVVSGCADPMDEPEGVVAAVLDADDVCINTEMFVKVDEGSDYWVTEQHRPRDWTGDIRGTFSWRGLDGEFVAADGTVLRYRRLGEGEFSVLHCAI
jgi:hypothetical protein